MLGRIYRTRGRARPRRRRLDRREAALRRLRPYLTPTQYARAEEVRDFDALVDLAVAVVMEREWM